MANHKSAAKRARQIVRRTTANQNVKSAVRTMEKQLLAAIGKKDVDKAKNLIVQYESQMDKAAQKNVFHKNHAARKVGRLARRVDNLSSAKQS